MTMDKTRKMKGANLRITSPLLITYHTIKNNMHGIQK